MFLSVQIEKIRPHMDSLAPLLEEYQKGDPGFPDDALLWLDETEKTLNSIRADGGSEISSLRGRILKAADALYTGSENHPGRWSEAPATSRLPKLWNGARKSFVAWFGPTRSGWRCSRTSCAKGLPHCPC